MKLKKITSIEIEVGNHLIITVGLVEPIRKVSLRIDNRRSPMINLDNMDNQIIRPALYQVLVEVVLFTGIELLGQNNEVVILLTASILVEVHREVSNRHPQHHREQEINLILL